MDPQHKNADLHGLVVDPQERAADLLRDFYIRSHRVIDRMMAANGASYSRARLLMFLAREGPQRSIDLAISLGYAPRTITEAIDGMERDGLVRRDPDPDDRRAKRITITPAGRTATESAEAARIEFVGNVFGALTGPERDEFARLIGKLNAKLATLEG